MPWIDDEMRAAIEDQLREKPGIETKINKVHFDPGPEATRDNVITQIADSLAEFKKRRAKGEPMDAPPRTGRPQTTLSEIVDSE